MMGSSARGFFLRASSRRPKTDKEKSFLRRARRYHLTGLPPTPRGDRSTSLAGESSRTNTYKHVDALLQSRRYGERMAMPWLDPARYADTHGYHIDSVRDMWPWRDWVIDAFNQQHAVRRFDIEQLAGDLLPNATREQKIATGFNRNHMINFEGGAIPRSTAAIRRRSRRRPQSGASWA